MLSVFFQPVARELDGGVPTAPMVARSMSVLATNVHNVIRHYRDQTYTVMSQHMVHVLLEMCMSSVDYDYFQYLAVVTDRAGRIARLRGIYTPTQPGRRFKASLYPHAECHELWLHLDDIDYSLHSPDDWEGLRSLVCIDHGFSDLNYDIPNGRTSRYSQRDTVWGIDIVGMCLQYRGWALERRRMGLSESTLQFVHSVVLPSALPSIIDLTVINRYWALCYGTPMTKSGSVLPIQIHTVSNLDQQLSSLIRTNRQRPDRFRDVLRAIPTVMSGSALKVLELPNVIRLDSVLGLLYYARLTHIENLVRLSNRTNRANRDYISQMITQHRRMITGSLIYRTLPDVANDVLGRIHELQRETHDFFN